MLDYWPSPLFAFATVVRRSSAALGFFSSEFLRLESRLPASPFFRNSASRAAPRLTDEAVIEATEQAKRDGLVLFEPAPVYPRPRGRAPSGRVWSFETGEWLTAAAMSAPAKQGAKMKRKRVCGTPGWELADGHIGLCSCAIVQHKRVCGA